MKFHPGVWIEILWVILGVYWLIAAVRLNQMRKREPAGERLVHVLIMVAGFFLLYKPNPLFEPLNRRFLPPLYWVYVLGVGLTFVGMVLAIWARYHIGRYWSGSTSIRADHELIRTGPYSRIRHPIYTGMLCMIVGTTLVMGEYRALVGTVILLGGLIRKAKKEEALLTGEFGEAFREHRQRTGFFLPRLRMAAMVQR